MIMKDILIYSLDTKILALVTFYCAKSLVFINLFKMILYFLLLINNIQEWILIVFTLYFELEFFQIELLIFNRLIILLKV
jgi:hypothetical protein